jgi:urocanate hydratase
VVYGGTGRAARSWPAFDAIVRSLRELTTTRRSSSSREAGRGGEDASEAPRVLIANSLLVPAWATWDEFRALEAQGSRCTAR